MYEKDDRKIEIVCTKPQKLKKNLTEEILTVALRKPSLNMKKNQTSIQILVNLARQFSVAGEQVLLCSQAALFE